MNTQSKLPGNRETHVVILIVLTLGIASLIANMAYGKGASLWSAATARRVSALPPAYATPGYTVPGYQVQLYNPPGYSASGYKSTGKTSCPATVNASSCKNGWITCNVQPMTEVPRSAVIKTNSTTLYWYGKDGKRYVFPNERTYRTWFTLGDACPVIRQVSREDLAAIPIGGNVTYHPGLRLLKLATDPTIYAVGKGGIARKFARESVIAQIFGSSWKSAVDVIPDVFFVNYTIGPEIINRADYVKAQQYQSAKTIDEDKGL